MKNNITVQHMELEIKKIFDWYNFSEKEILYWIKYHWARIASAIYANQKRDWDTTFTFFQWKWKCDNCWEESIWYRTYCSKCKKSNITIS